LGNDYVYINGFNEPVANPANLARRISDRHTGIGSDGLIIIQPSKTADVRMEMYNADGSRGLMCGNGIRCVAKFAVERGLASGPDLRIETDSGIKDAICHFEGEKVGTVQVDMGRPSLLARDIPAIVPEVRSSKSEVRREATGNGPQATGQEGITATDNRQSAIGNLMERIIEVPLKVGGEKHLVTCVSMGNPHAVVFTENLHRIDLARVGPLFENAPEFPQRINTHFVRVDSPGHVTMRTWERGSGATRACGTGACAVCVAGAITGRTQRKLTVELPGGVLEIEWANDDRVLMTGEAVEVFSGEWLL
jgi:diaminopimelate epimerase